MDDYEFALCLTHDVDRPSKTFQAPYYALKERDPSHLQTLFTSEEPYWQFEDIMQLEADLGVRSSFYFLNEKRLLSEKSPREWFRPESWMLYTGRYNIADDRIVEVMQSLSEGGWEVGLHGSYDSYREPDRLAMEKEMLESLVGQDIIGGRQHYLNLDQPTTWEYHRDVGLQYDASLGSSTEYGFRHGYDILRPFDDDFVVFPLTIMECALMKSAGGIEEAKRECDRLLEEASRNDGVMTVLWHPRFFNTDEFSSYRELYAHLVTTAKQMGAWIGSCKEYYERRF